MSDSNNHQRLTSPKISDASDAISPKVSKDRLLSFFDAGDYVSIVLSAYLITSTINLLIVDAAPTLLIFAEHVHVKLSFLSFSFYVLLLIVFHIWTGTKKLTRSVLVTFSFFFGLLTIINNGKDIFLTIGIIAIVSLIIYGSCREKYLWDMDDQIDVNNKVSFGIVTLLFLGMSSLVAISTIYRFRTFNSSTFDFGIFAQMFEYLRTTGLPTTTLERNQLLSHFAIHFSPIYYLLLPGYHVFPVPEYLLVVQALLICSSVFPFYLLCRHFNINHRITILLSSVCLFLPGLISPSFYDFHENKFLTVLLLWMLYFFEKKKYVPMYLFMFLTLSVKEDAALYIMFIGLYYIFSRLRSTHGLIIFSSAIFYFTATIILMGVLGHGIMDNRFAIYQLSGETGLLPVAKNILIHPAFFVQNLFSEEKFRFIVYMLGPLLFIPLLSKNLINYILLIPMLVMNLMTTYPYQYDIGYQYTYGVSAILLFLFILNFKVYSNKRQHLIALIAVFSSISLLITATGPKFISYYSLYNSNQIMYEQSQQVLRQIPADASVTSETFFTPHLFKVKTLYMYPSYYGETELTDYLVLDVRLKSENSEEKASIIQNGGYQMIASEGLVMIYKRE